MYLLKLTPHYQNSAHWNEFTNSILEQHWNYLLELDKQGIIEVVGRTNYPTEHSDLLGIVIFTADTQETAREIMENDPCIKHQVMTASVHPFNLALKKKG